MKSFLVAGLLAATAITGVTAAISQTAEPTPPAQASTGAQYGSFGFDEKGMDKTVQPGDDFYTFANGNWSKANPIPADKSNYGSFNLLSDLSETRTRGILDTAAKDKSSKIGRAYATFLDTGTIEAKGLAPIRPWLKKIAALTDRAGYPALLAEADRAGIGGPFGGGVGQDDKSPEQYALSLGQSGLGLPDRDYYLSEIGRAHV